VVPITWFRITGSLVAGFPVVGFMTRNSRINWQAENKPADRIPQGTIGIDTVGKNLRESSKP
jgi:hypothetical protein